MLNFDPPQFSEYRSLGGSCVTSLDHILYYHRFIKKVIISPGLQIWTNHYWWMSSYFSTQLWKDIKLNSCKVCSWHNRNNTTSRWTSADNLYECRACSICCRVRFKVKLWTTSHYFRFILQPTRKFSYYRDRQIYLMFIHG